MHLNLPHSLTALRPHPHYILSDYLSEKSLCIILFLSPIDFPQCTLRPTLPLLLPHGKAHHAFLARSIASVRPPCHEICSTPKMTNLPWVLEISLIFPLTTGSKSGSKNANIESGGSTLRSFSSCDLSMIPQPSHEHGGLVPIPRGGHQPS